MNIYYDFLGILSRYCIYEEKDKVLYDSYNRRTIYKDTPFLGDKKQK